MPTQHSLYTIPLDYLYLHDPNRKGLGVSSQIFFRAALLAICVAAMPSWAYTQQNKPSPAPTLRASAMTVSVWYMNKTKGVVAFYLGLLPGHSRPRILILKPGKGSMVPVLFSEGQTKRYIPIFQVTMDEKNNPKVKFIDSLFVSISGGTGVFRYFENPAPTVPRGTISV